MRALLLLVALGGCQLVFPLGDDEGDDVIDLVDTWQAVTAGLGHSCALDVDGRAFCWGRNADGELGRMGTGELAAIREVGTTSELWLSVTTSHRHTCGIKADSAAWCWGANEHGQLGNGGKSPSSEPVATPIGAVHAIATSDLHTCAITLDRTMSCWGANGVGELGNGMVSEDVNLPVLVAGGPWEAVVVGTSESSGRAGSTCAIAEDRTLWCWGQTLGVPNTSVPTPAQLSTDAWRTIALGNNHGCGITDVGTMRCWGSNARGQLGNGTTTTSQAPVGALVDNEDRRDWTAVAVNADHSCGIAGGQWFCWGGSTTGQLGLDGNATNPVPVELGAGVTWTKLAAGVGHTCAVAADQSLWCVGSRGFSQLGNDSSSAQLPRKLAGAWLQVSVGQLSTCGIATDNTAHCTGDNRSGTLGNGTSNAQQLLRAIDADQTWTALSAGMFHTCGVRNFEVVCWGQDYVAQVTGMPSNQKLTPTAVSPSVSATTVSVNGEHSCALVDVQGETKCWGGNANGQLGRDTTSTSGSPGNLPDKFSVVEAGEVHTCGINSSNRVDCWGLGTDGRLGLGEAIQSNVMTPRPIMNPNAFTALSVGDGSACGIDTSGALFCWGTNYSGELGVGNRSSQLTPEQVAGSWTAISVGSEHSCGLQGDRLFCWGTNDRGQLGLGSFTEQLTPLAVATDISWKAVSTGERVTCAIDATDALYCWGDNSVGQLGTGDAWSIELVQVIAK